MSISGYTKLFSSIIGSTIWSENNETRIVWITMLALVNQHGEVQCSIVGLAKFANVSIADTESAIKTLLAPDAYSRTKDHEGRRIMAIEGGWFLLNHGKYRDAQSEDDRREQNRIAQARFREKHKVSAE